VSKLESPNIAIAWDEPVSAYNAGHTRFVIERQMGYPVTAIRTMQLLRSDLDGLDVLILPEGRYADVLNDKAVEKIKQWVSDGGVLLTLGSASAWAVEAGVLNTKLERKVPEEGVTKPEDETKVDGKVIESREQFLTEIKPHGADPDWVPGALLNAEVDTDHWLSAGVKPQVISIYNGNDVFTPIDINQGRNIAWFADADNMLASGFLWDDIAQQLPYKPLLMWQPTGNGMVISFTQEPTYRAYMDGLNTLLMNALFLAPAKAQ
jgi:hypothetical protein